ncbi:MAG: inositol monophosphatase [Gammaproteobacteria bacterium]|nr:inositol monophosphatase [Gammaproteobacteria bacterium]
MTAKNEINFSLDELARLRDIVSRAAREELLPRFTVCLRHEKADGSTVTEADFALHHRLESELARRWPGYAFLSEEMAAEQQQQLMQHAETGLWCLDPLDGTTNFAAGIPFFAVSLALLVAGEARAAIIYDPIRDEMFSACKGQGVWLNGERLTPQPEQRSLRQCVAVVDFKRLTAPLAERLARTPPYLSQRNFGSVALEWCWLAAGRFHVYMHGGQKLWDYAAGSLILSETGGFALTLNGTPVCCADLQPSSVVAALDERLFQEWKAWLAGGRPPDLLVHSAA